ncbi:MAG: hypothetical protein LT080_10390 [Thiobacillus sp.]|nr:hypothetical protein [Thiobacillus sp.]
MKIVLTAEHEHAGRVCDPGSELTLTDAEAAALINAGKAKPATAATSHTARAAAAPKAIESTQDKEQQA